jgi:hypothetical protein
MKSKTKRQLRKGLAISYIILFGIYVLSLFIKERIFNIFGLIAAFIPTTFFMLFLYVLLVLAIRELAKKKK